MTLATFQEGLENFAEWAKNYVAAYVAGQPLPVDPSAEAVKQALDQLNGEVIGTSSWEKVTASLLFKGEMKTIFDSLGFVDTNKFRNYPTMLAKATQPTGVYIEDTNGNLWTAANWAIHTTEVASCAVVITSALSFRVGFRTTSLAMCSNTEIFGLAKLNTTTDVLNDTRDFLDSTKAIIGFANPQVLGLNSNGVFDKDTLIANIASNSHYYDSLAEFQALTSGVEGDLYIVNYAGTTDGTNMHVYYWNNAQFVDCGVRPINQGSDPYKGAPASVYCWKYKAFEGDESQWGCPNAKMLQAMYNNKSALQDCFRAVLGSTFTETNSWCCQQPANSSYGWYMYLGTGSLSNSNKNSGYMVFPVAAY